MSDACLWLGPPWLYLQFSYALSVSKEPSAAVISDEHSAGKIYLTTLVASTDVCSQAKVLFLLVRCVIVYPT